MDNAPTTLHVTCLCAAWCGLCRDYRTVVDDLAARFAGQAVFRWLDIEDEAALVDELDVEDFPTVLIAAGPQVRFYGTITPQPSTLERLVQRALDGELAATALPDGIGAVAQRLAENPNRG